MLVSLWCDHSNESFWAVLSCGTVYKTVVPTFEVDEILVFPFNQCAVQDDSYFWVCIKPQSVTIQMELELLSNSFLWCCLLCCKLFLNFEVGRGNSMICSHIWHKYHERYFKIVQRNFTSRWASEIWDNFEISRVVFMPNITHKSWYYLFILLPAKGL